MLQRQGLVREIAQELERCGDDAGAEAMRAEHRTPHRKKGKDPS
eukprot:gene36655-36541_t